MGQCKNCGYATVDDGTICCEDPKQKSPALVKDITAFKILHTCRQCFYEASPILASKMMSVVDRARLRPLQSLQAVTATRESFSFFTFVMNQARNVVYDNHDGPGVCRWRTKLIQSLKLLPLFPESEVRGSQCCAQAVWEE